jgi:hypothetical protein
MSIKKNFGLPTLALAVTVAMALRYSGACREQKAQSDGIHEKVAGAAASVPPKTTATTDPELPRVFLDTTYRPSANRPIEVKAGDDFQAALNRAKPGDVITLQAGSTFTGNFKLPNKTGARGNAPGAEPWIVIRTSAGDGDLPAPGNRLTPERSAALPKLISPNSDPVIAAAKGAHHYRLIGLEVGVKPATMIYNLIDFGAGQSSPSEVPHDLIVDRCYIHGNPTDNARRGVAVNSASTAVIDSYISDIHEVGADSQAIAGWNGPGPFKIVNNYLEGAGENVMFGGADASIQNLVPSDIEFKKNHVAKPLKWKLGHASYAGKHWAVKNLFELKNAQRVLADSNVLEFNWGDGQDGTAVLFTPRNQSGGSPWSVVADVTFTNNIVRHSGSGFNISGPDNEAGVSLPSQRVLIRNNLIEDIDGKAWGSQTTAVDGELFQIVGGAEYITIDHNTGFASGNILTADSNKDVNKALVFTNNIAPHNAYGVIGSGTGPGTASLSRWFNPYIFKNNVIVGGQASSYPPGNHFVRSFNDVKFTDMANGDYRLTSSSPFRNASAGGSDIGCNLTAFNGAASIISGASAGAAANPKRTSENNSSGGTH